MFSYIKFSTDFSFVEPNNVILLLTNSAQQELVFFFTITWEPNDASTSSIVHYNVDVTPAPPYYDPTNTTNSSVSVSLKVDLLYNITITQNLCSLEQTSSFTLGKHFSVKISVCFFTI